jgi:putative phosphoesterase
MKAGIFADSHDHLDNIRRVVALFNSHGCEAALFAGDLVSTFAVPPLRKLNCPLFACFGDNEGNKSGLRGGFSIIGEINEAPAAYVLQDGTRVVIAHMERQLRGYEGEFDVAVFGHTHKPHVFRDDAGRLWINPGETSGWTYGNPTVALLDTTSQSVEIIAIPKDEPIEAWSQVRGRTGEASN